MESLRGSLFPPPSHHNQRYNARGPYPTRRKGPASARDPSDAFTTQDPDNGARVSPLPNTEDTALDSGVVAYLTTSTTDKKQTVIRIFNGEETLIGRHPHCQFQIPHPSCSNIHCRIYSVVFESAYEPLIYCEDLSMNGTLLNGRLIGKCVSVLLNHGDRVEICPGFGFTFRQVPTEGAEGVDDLGVEGEEALFEGSYKLSKRILGEGGYGRVYMAWDVKTHRQVACKIMVLRDDGGHGGGKKNWKRMKEMYMREVEILKTLNHPNIMRIHKVVSTNSRFYIFEDLITGGDLFSHLGQKVCFDEVEAMPIVWQILKALEYLHERGIVHRDLKPDNILCTSSSPGARIVLTDFGSARFFTTATRMTSAVGTLEYLAPEILPGPRAQTGYSKSVDLWSLGIVIYVLLSGYSPFGASHGATLPPNAVIAKARSCDLSRLDTGTEWRSVSAEAKDFIRALVCVDPRKRLTAAQAGSHRWLSRHREELEEVYGRAVGEWREVGGEEVVLEHFGGGEEMGGFWFGAGESLEDVEMVDVPELVVDVGTPESVRGGTGEGEGWRGGLYTVEEDELYDAAAGDGRLRSARELARDVEARREARRGGRVEESGGRSRFFMGC